jgi:S1-C subfamily serine protease
LRVHVTLVDSQLNLKPVPKHVLVFADRAHEAARFTATTAVDGTAELQLPIGTYHVYSERPVNLEGRFYRWDATLTVRVGTAAVFELSSDTAIVSESHVQSASQNPDWPRLFQEWQASVATIWSEAGGHGTGFLVDKAGLFLTNAHVVGDAEAVSVQLDATRKVAGRVVAKDETPDIAVIRVHPAPVSGVHPVVLGYGRQPIEGSHVFTIGSPLHQRKVMTTGMVSRVEARAIISDINANPGNSGGPLFAPDGVVIGVITFVDQARPGPGISGIVRIDEARSLLEQARAVVPASEPPLASLLPVEPQEPFPIEMLKELVSGRFDFEGYGFDDSDFEYTFMTPVVRHAAAVAGKQIVAEERRKRTRKQQVPDRFNPLEGFYGWGEALGLYTAVVDVRIRPKLAEGFWSALGRGMAATQGVWVAPRLRFKTDLERLRLLCGGKEVLPIHRARVPLVLWRDDARANVKDAAYEGRYMYPPDALGTHCGEAHFEVLSGKDSSRPRRTVIPDRVLRRMDTDFRPYFIATGRVPSHASVALASGHRSTRDLEPVSASSVQPIGDAGHRAVGNRSARIRVTTAPSGAYLYLGQVRVGETTDAGALLDLREGKHSILIRKAGYLPTQREVVVQGGAEPSGESRIAVTLVEDRSSISNRASTADADSELTVSAARVRIVTDPADADVLVADRLVGRTSERGFLIEIPQGRTKITLRKSGYLPRSRTLIFTQAQPITEEERWNVRLELDASQR